MGTKIRVLSDQTINQIAAGEVIENPASVVKELVENSLDAGATKVVIEIMGGGFLQIRIEDDGEGMGNDDAYLAFERHATSKLKTLDDLMQITSMGFRGEALASISAVAKVDLETCNGKETTRVGCYGGKIVYQEKGAREKGTTVTVSSLFYNVPARKKFQKTAERSLADIIKMVTKLSLAHRGVSFKLLSHDKEVIKTSGQKEIALEEVLGNQFLPNGKPIFFEEDGHVLEGFIGSPLETRASRLSQYLFINNRPIFSPFVAKVIKEAYGTRIGAHEYPVFALWLSVPGKFIDVNVHPQKTEVRFQYESMIESFLKKGVLQVLTEKEGVFFEEVMTERAPTFHFKMAEEVIPPKKEVPLPIKREKRIDLILLMKHLAFVRLSDFDSEEIFLVDLAKASSRIQFEEILGRLNGKEKEMQSLLFPKTIELIKQEALAILPHLDLLRALGIEMRPFGKESFIVEAIAPYFSIDEVQEIISSFIDDMKVAKTNEQLAKRAASYQRKKTFLESEVRPIFSHLLKMSDPYHALDGGKIIVPIDEKRLERLYE